MANPVSSSVTPRQLDVVERLTPGLQSLYCGTYVRLGVHLCGPSSDPICVFPHERLPSPASLCLSLDRAHSVVSVGVLSPQELGWNHPIYFHMLYYPLGQFICVTTTVTFLRQGVASVASPSLIGHVFSALSSSHTGWVLRNSSDWPSLLRALTPARQVGGGPIVSNRALLGPATVACW